MKEIPINQEDLNIILLRVALRLSKEGGTWQTIHEITLIRVVLESDYVLAGIFAANLS
jgi:hypothetical protein